MTYAHLVELFREERHLVTKEPSSVSKCTIACLCPVLRSVSSYSPFIPCPDRARNVPSHSQYMHTHRAILCMHTPQEASLHRAILCMHTLQEASLHRAILCMHTPQEASLHRAILCMHTLQEASLHRAILCMHTPQEASLHRAILCMHTLQEASLTRGQPS